MFNRRGTPWLVFQWVESGAPPQPATAGPRRVGFGSELIEGRIPYELRGRGKVVIEAGGARCDLVLEDDYYIATDTARALRGAGAEVIGPCAREDDARDAIADAGPTCAVVDINLGSGPSFDLARELRADGVPIVFITGYDQEVIPDDLVDVQRLQKPVQFRQIIGALAKAVGLRDQKSIAIWPLNT